MVTEPLSCPSAEYIISSHLQIVWYPCYSLPVTNVSINSRQRTYKVLKSLIFFCYLINNVEANLMVLLQSLQSLCQSPFNLVFFAGSCISRCCIKNLLGSH